MEDTDLAAWNRGVFAIGQTTVTIGDTICAAHFRGELAATWKRIVAIMEEGDSVSSPDDVELQASSEQFRIDRDLITAEETERWLKERGLTLDDFNNFLVRQWIDQAVNSELVGHEVIDYISAPPDLRDALRIDLLFSGEFDRLATRLGWRSAAREGAQDRVSDEAIEIERACFYQRSGTNDASLPARLAGLELPPVLAKRESAELATRFALVQSNAGARSGLSTRLRRAPDSESARTNAAVATLAIDAI